MFIPKEAPAANNESPAPQLSPRLRRLRADYEQMQQAFAGSEMIYVESADGDPPERYHIRYAVTGLEAGEGKTPVHREMHRIEIQLTADYPRAAPLCRMLTSVFHPNIDPAHICIGDHWTAGERLPDLVIRIGELLAYQAYNIKSPLNAQAAMWTDLHAAELPIDPRPLRPPGW
jgi:ubiquitin-protein ligase